MGQKGPPSLWVTGEVRKRFGMEVLGACVVVCGGCGRERERACADSRARVRARITRSGSDCLSAQPACALAAISALIVLGSFGRWEAAIGSRVARGVALSS